jgi:hypothetical protein
MADTHIREEVVRERDNAGNSGVTVGLVLGAILVIAIILFFLYYDNEPDTGVPVTPTQQQQQNPTPQQTNEGDTEQTQDEDTQLFFEENTEVVIPTEEPTTEPEPSPQTMRNDHYQLVVML